MIKDKTKQPKTVYLAILITVFVLALSVSPAAAQASEKVNKVKQPADTAQPQSGSKNKLVIMIGKKTIDAAVEAAAAQQNPETADIVRQQLHYLLQVPELLEGINREDFFKPYNLQATGEISVLLNRAADIETDECHKLYLTELSQNIREDTFHTVTQDWLSLEENIAEIIFVPDNRYKKHELFLRALSPFNLGRMEAEGKGPQLSNFIRKQLNAAAPKTGDADPYKLFNTYIFLNDRPETWKYEEYTRLYGKMRDRVATNRAPMVPFTGRPPALKIAHLAYATSANRLSTVYPYPGLFYLNQANNPDHKYPYKLIIFKNLVDAYVRCILDPIARIVLLDTAIVPGHPEKPSPKSVQVAVTGDTCLSNHVMYSISQNIGEIFTLRPKVDPLKKKDDDEFAPEQKTRGNSRNEEKDLKLIPEAYEAQFPMMDGMKSTVVSLYNTVLLMEEGLLPWEKEADIYATYLVTALDNIRRNPKKPGNKHHVIMFNYLLENGGIFFNITTRKISVNVLEFRKNLEDLAKIVTEKYLFLIPSFRKYDMIGSELKAIIEMLSDIPAKTDVQFEN